MTDDKNSDLLAMPLLDDIMIYMFVANLQDGRVWANYQQLKDFFEELQSDPKEWATATVRDMIDRIVIDNDIDRALTRVMGFAGFTYLCDSNDHLYASSERAGKLLKRHFFNLAANVQVDFVEISHRYGALLKKIGRQ